MIDMKAMLADRETGTQGPFFPAPVSPYVRGSLIFDEKWNAVADVHSCYVDAIRFARVPELEQALIDARAALEKTIAQLDIEHADYMLGKGRDPAKYVSQWSRAADSLRATLKGLGE